MKYEELVALALEAKEMAYVPYSGFHVGAALLSKDGQVFKGCNIENAAYGPTNCAERTAIFKAVSEGVKEFAMIAVASDSDDFTSPCGICRQVMAEFCGPEFVVLMSDKNGNYKETTLGELLPFAFSL